MVLSEVQSLVDRGYKEIVLSGIHLGTYGRDLDSPTSLLTLIHRMLDEIPDLARIRLSSIEPLEVTPDIVALVAGEPRLAHHFHIPLQSGSRRILREMRRPYTPSYYADLAQTIRARIGDAAIGADVMVGFPGETDDDFLETYRLIEQSALTYLHVFPFSPRPGTVAAALPNQVTERVSRFRAGALRSAIARKNKTFRRNMIGSEIDVLTLEGGGSALSSNFVRVMMPESVEVNRWMRVLVTGLHDDGVQASKITIAQETS